MKEQEKTINYLNKTKNHLFTKESFIRIKPNSFKLQEYMFKTFNISINNIPHMCIIEFNDELTNVYINEIVNNENSFNLYKRSKLFQGNQKTKAIKTFKKIRLIMDSIKYNYESVEEAKLDITEKVNNGK